ncbi:MAG: Ppx/GppA phosphatase family protein [Pseudomonadota bacterium]
MSQPASLTDNLALQKAAPVGLDPDLRGGGICAAVDLGTNNCRLLVAQPADRGFKVIDAFSRIVRLGQGVDVNGRLSPESMGRTIGALRICASKIRRRGVTASRAVATEACRKAGNFDQFRARVARETGLKLELISPAEEARLALSGCAPLLDRHRRHAIVFDIGGGSTEVMWLSVSADTGAAVLIDSVSLSLGVVNLSERFGGDRMSEDRYETIIDEVMSVLARFDAVHGIADLVSADRVQMIGSSGTVTTLAGVSMGLPRYDRSRVDGSYLDMETAIAVSRSLLALDFKGRAAEPCIGRERSDLVVAGCAVFEAIGRLWPVSQLRVADRGVREGILFDLMMSGMSRSPA